ncbi:hypothetical protein AB0O32_38355 [Streptomyces rubiginosohelvolus]|uniref:hypothetical protein n=1 Tax=Streptomyces rubiginosohelvolus TaxID=67362 RepID=UPI003422BFC0
MNAAVRLPGRFSRHALLIATAAAVPLTGWAAHTLHQRLTATRKDPMTGLLRRGGPERLLLWWLRGLPFGPSAAGAGAGSR